MSKLTNLDELRWQAVAERDRSQENSFFFAVRSTGIFCRPGCRSRTPRREQVVFYDTTEAARQAGFRPCKRCRPEEGGPGSAHTDLVQKVCALLDAADRPLTLAELGQSTATSPSHLQRVFKAVMGISPRQYAATRRLERFKKAARQHNTISAAMYESGYRSTSRLYEQSGLRLGMSPGRYASGGRTMKIYYTVEDTALGKMLLAGTEQGVAGLAFADDETDLLTFLSGEFPGAELVREDSRMTAWAGVILAYLDGDLVKMQQLTALPLDVQATTFQAKVWEALRQIPAGETRTYTQVAHSLGQPTAVRAVARACATNPVSLITPCHRVVRSNGSLAGYRWGLTRKQALLDMEHRLKESAV